MNALVIEPGHGSLWLSDCRWVDTDSGRYIEGLAWDDGGVGSPYLPADFMGEEAKMNFPENLVLQTTRVYPSGMVIVRKKPRDG